MKKCIVTFYFTRNISMRQHTEATTSMRENNVTSVTDAKRGTLQFCSYDVAIT